MGMFTDYFENKLIDWIYRGQTYAIPSTWYIGLLTAAPTDSTTGTEVSGGSYARVAATRSLAKWAGTQGAGTTAASSGTSGTTSNNEVFAFPVPSGNWGVVTHVGIWDSLTGGNLCIFGALTVPKTVNNGDPAPSFPADTLSLQLD